MSVETQTEVNNESNRYVYQLIETITGNRSKPVSGTESEVYAVLKKQANQENYFLVLCDKSGEFSCYPLMRISTFVREYELRNGLNESDNKEVIA